MLNCPILPINQTNGGTESAIIALGVSAFQVYILYIYAVPHIEMEGSTVPSHASLMRSEKFT